MPEAGGSEDEAIAGLLHEAVEDAGSMPCEADIRARKEASRHRNSRELGDFVRHWACIRDEQAQWALIRASPKCFYANGVSLLVAEGLSSFGRGAVPRPPAEIAVANTMSAHAPNTNDALVRTPDI